VSDGLPTPTLTWYKPNGNKLNTVTVKESTVKMTTTDDQDFEEPGSPVIISSATDIQATSLTVKWTAPTDDGGSSITAYRVVMLKGST